MLPFASRSQVEILSKFDWSKEYEESHPDAGGTACMCLEDIMLAPSEKEEIEGMALEGLCWKESLPLGDIWHLTPRGAVEIALNED